MAGYIAAAMATQAVGSMMGGKGAARQASQQQKAFEQDLDYRMWADRQDAEQEYFRNQLGMAQLGNQARNNWRMSSMSLAGRLGAPGQPISTRMPEQEAMPEQPAVQTYPGYQGKQNTFGQRYSGG